MENAGQANGSKKRYALVAVLLLIVAGIAATATVLVTRSSDDVGVDADAAVYVVTQAAATQPVFEPKFVEGDDAFFPLDAQISRYEADGGADVNDATIETGLYGGTVDETCDPERLIEYLYDNPVKGQAWAQAQGIPFSQLGAYIRSLDARVLADSALVVNHGFDAARGSATAIETTLEAGTAVLVDADGQIRARCYCGNPVTPRPAVYREPTCLITPALVFTEPGGTDPRPGAPTQVGTTGQRATADDAFAATPINASGSTDTWTQIAWGDTATESGWTRRQNLQPGVCQPVNNYITQCAQVGAAVWAEPNESQQVGRLGGELRTNDTTLEQAASVVPIGGDDPAIENDFALIEFRQASPSAASTAWVRRGDLQESACGAPIVCIETLGPIKDQAGGIGLRPAGTYLVEFTGHFAAFPVSSTEVRLVGESARGWVSNFYTPQPDAACDTPAERPNCVGGLEVPLWEQTDSDEVIGIITGVRGQILSATPVDGRVQISLPVAGPAVWVDEALLTPDPVCRTTRLCVALTGPLRSQPFDDATPVGGPTGFTFAERHEVIYWGPGGSMFDGSAWVLLEAGGTTGWANASIMRATLSDLPCREGLSPIREIGVLCISGARYSEPVDDALLAGEQVSTRVRGPLAQNEGPGGPWLQVSEILEDGIATPFWVKENSVLDTSACEANAQPAPSPTVEATPTPTPTPEPTAEPDPEPTAAPAPQPTAPPTATPTPEPTAEPTCPDADGDGVCNADDNCRDLANPDQADADGDDKGDACDPCTDADLDLHCAETDDTCPNDYDPSLLDTENDGVGDACDNCPYTTNPNQADSDGDGTGNACETEGGGTPTDPPGASRCPAGFEPDPSPQYANDPTPPCYPACTTGVMTPGGTCCGLTQAEVQVLGCCALTCPASAEPGARLDDDGVVTALARPDDAWVTSQAPADLGAV